MTFTIRLMLLVGILAAAQARAEIYELPPEGFDVVGAIATVTAREEDTLIDIARRQWPRLSRYRARQPGRQYLGARRGHRGRSADPFRTSAGPETRHRAESRRVPPVLLPRAERGRAGLRDDLSDKHRAYGLGNSARFNNRHLEGQGPKLVSAEVSQGRARGGGPSIAEYRTAGA